MKQTKILELLNNLTTYEKLELVNKLIHSDQLGEFSLRWEPIKPESSKKAPRMVLRLKAR